MTAEEIAAKLSPAQRWLVQASGPDDITGQEGLGIDLRGSMFRVAKALHRLGLGDYTHGSPIADMYWNKPLGLAVRSILEGTSHEQQ